ncbi:MAG: thioredoxin family protein [Chitinophagaceae bacterium]
MKKIFFSALPVAVIAIMALSPLSDPLPLGSPIPKPDVKMKDISGKEVSLKDAKTGKGLLVMFSCNTCPFVIKNQERTIEAAKHAMNNGIGVAILNSNEGQRGDDDSYEAMKNYAKDQGYNWYYLVDNNSALADAFGANKTPECFLFNGEGNLVYHGAIDDRPADASSVTRKHLVAAMDEMKAGKDISVKESKSVGCGIKRL